MEDDSHEGDLFEGCEDEDNATFDAHDETEGEEINVNGKNNKDVVQTGDKEPKRTDASAKFVGSSTKVQNPTNSPIPNNSAIHKTPVTEPIDPGDTGGGEKQKIADKLNRNPDQGNLELKGNAEVSAKSPGVIEQMIKDNAAKILIPKPTKNQIAAAEQQKKMEDNTGGKGRDLDVESTSQNFMNIARQGDLSPKHIEKGKSVGRGRKKQVKEIPNV